MNTYEHNFYMRYSKVIQDEWWIATYRIYGYGSSVVSKC